MVNKSMLDVAHEFIVARGEPVSFNDIWQEVLKELPDTPADRMARFYTNMTLDGRFVALGGNMWDLRIKYSFKDLYEDVRGVFREVEEIEEEKEIDPFEEPEEELLSDDNEEEIEDIELKEEEE